MPNLFPIIKKNIKILLRSKSASLIIILGPLLVILLIGFGYNTSTVYDIRISSYSSSYSDLANSIVDQLNKENFNVAKVASEDICVKDVKLGISHICMIIPADLSVKSDETKNIVFYADYSRINLVYVILDKISSRISTKSSEISLELTQSLLDKLDQTQKELTERKSNIESISSLNQELSSSLENILNSIQDINPTLTESDIETITSSIAAIQSSSINQSQKDYLISSLTNIKENAQSNLDELSSTKEDITEKIDQSDSILSTSSEHLSKIINSVNSLTSTLESFDVRNAKRITSPITTSIKPIVSERTYLSYTFPTLMVLIILFVCILLSSALVVEEKTSNAFFRNSITPTHDLSFILGNYFTNLIIILIQLFIIILIAMFFFKDEVLLRSVAILAVLIIIISTLFILLGMLIGYVLKSEETATLTSILIGSVFLFFSNTILPIESLPPYLKEIASYNPFVISETILKKTLMFEATFTTFKNDIYILLIFIAILFALIWISHKFIKTTYRLKRWFIKENITEEPKKDESKKPTKNEKETSYSMGSKGQT